MVEAAWEEPAACLVEGDESAMRKIRMKGQWKGGGRVGKERAQVTTEAFVLGQGHMRHVRVRSLGQVNEYRNNRTSAIRSAANVGGAARRWWRNVSTCDATMYEMNPVQDVYSSFCGVRTRV